MNLSLLYVVEGMNFKPLNRNLFHLYGSSAYIRILAYPLQWVRESKHERDLKQLFLSHVKM